ncbi:hypothetical protein F5X99DRAFT_399976 [Biscogniauxia marginata]|nr:hypothetical protein F5X99DRAFT_399976 [Biscogniauxia marginata]
MASTRASTGNSRPRVHNTVSTAPERKRRTTGGTGTTAKKRGATTAATKKNNRTTGTSTSTGAGVRKRGRPPIHHHKRKPHLSDKVEGAIEKAVGAATRSPGKKAAGTKKMRGTDGKNSRRGARRV